MKAKPASFEVAGRQAPGRKAMLRFLGIFLTLVAAYYALTLSPWVDANALYPVMKASACGTSVLLNFMGAKTTTEGVVVRGHDCAVAIRRGCDPLDPIALFAAAVIAFPAAWRRRLAGLVVASAFLFGLNLVRMVSLYLLRANKSPLFESFHLVWWPAFCIVCSLVLWVLWLLWIQRRGATSKSPVPAKTPWAKPRAPSRAGGV